MREKIRFDDDWKFYRGTPKTEGIASFAYHLAKTERKRTGPAAFDCPETSDDDNWRSVTLPHDFIIEQTPSPDENRSLGYFRYGDAWYRKEFTLPEEDRGRRISLLFDGVASQCEVYLNGILIGRNFSGYVSFEPDISDTANFGGKNVLALHVDTREHESWWYEGGGIYRSVWLLKKEDVSIDLWGVFAAPKKESDGTETQAWSVPIETELSNRRYEAVSVLLSHTLSDADGKKIAECETVLSLDGRESGKAHAEMSVSAPTLWDVDAPYLYTVHTVLSVDGKALDAQDDRIGFRTFRVDADEGFILNGRRVFINGVCAHQDFGLTGKAVPDNIHRYKIELIKEMGANGYRTSHYPHPEAVMDALDETGFIVLDETRWFSEAREHIDALEMLIKRDRNRPSVFFWSLANEEPILAKPSGRAIFKNLKAIVQKLDGTRPLTAADNHPGLESIFPELDIIGFNYNLPKYDEARKLYPDRPFLATECCASGTTRGQYDERPERSYMNAYDKVIVPEFTGREDMRKFLEAHPYIMGAYQWIAFEHRGETFWPRLCSQSGAIDLFLQKKDAFYQNKSHWDKKTPMVHLLPHWNFAGREGDDIRVVAYTNCEELELYLNGKSLGKQSIEPFGHGEWHVPYEKGVLSVEGRNGGVTVCRDEKVTTGRAQKLMLRLDNRIEEANGRDIAVVTCYCVDEAGRFVPDASPFVSFHTNGLGTVVGTGSDVSDTSPVALPDRKMRMGLVTAAVRVGKEAGTLRVYAESEGFDTVLLSLRLRRVLPRLAAPQLP